MSMDINWDGITLARTVSNEETVIRHSLADAAKYADWVRVFDLLSEQEERFVNFTRLDGSSWYAPLHQAAWHGAPVEIVRRLIQKGAWRALRNAKGERAVDVAERRGHRHLLEGLAPEFKHHVPMDVLLRVQAHFHAVIRERAGWLIEEYALRLPELEPLLELIPKQLINHRRLLIDGLSRGPFSACDGFDEVGSVLEFEPCHLDADEDILDESEDPVGEVIGFQVLEDVFHRVQFRAVGWQMQQREVGGNIQILGFVPSGTVEDDDSMASEFNRVADIAEMPVHFVGIRPAADMSDGALAFRACGGEEVAVPEAAVARDPWPGALAGPDPREHALLACSRLVLEPDLDRPGSTRRSGRQLAEVPAEILLCREVCLGMQRPWRDMPEAQPAQKLPDPFQRIPYRKNRCDPFRDIAQTEPRRHIRPDFRTRVDPACDHLQLYRRQPTATAAAARRAKALNPSVIVQDDPVPKRLRVNALGAGRLGSLRASHDHRYRAQAPCLRRGLAIPCNVFQFHTCVAAVRDGQGSHPSASSLFGSSFFLEPNIERIERGHTPYMLDAT